MRQGVLRDTMTGIPQEVELQVADRTRDVTPRVVGGSTLARPFPAARNREIGDRLAFGRGPWLCAGPPDLGLTSTQSCNRI